MVDMELEEITYHGHDPRGPGAVQIPDPFLKNILLHYNSTYKQQHQNSEAYKLCASTKTSASLPQSASAALSTASTNSLLKQLAKALNLFVEEALKQVLSAS